MKILILTQYYPPEIGAPQNRLHELAVRLQKAGVEVEVLTAMPNYPRMEIMDAYRGGKIREEVIDEISVKRAKIFVSKSKGIFARLLNYFSFVFTSYWRGRRLENADFLLVESPPLFLGYSAMRLAKKLNAKLIFNVSDLWPESAEKMGVVNNRRLLAMAYKLERKCYERSTLVTGQTQGIVDNISSRFPDTRVFWLPNGVDVEFYNPDIIQAGDLREEIGAKKEDILFFYGGIIGHAQGLETLLEAAKLLEHRTDFKIILQGAGPVKESLLKLNKELKLNSIVFREPVQKSEMPSILKSVDVALVPLRKLDIFQGAIPSKIFEAQAMKLPLLLGVDGEAKKHFINTAESGLYFEPENAKHLSECMIEMMENRANLKIMGENARAYVEQNFNRNVIAENLIKELNTLEKI